MITRGELRATRSGPLSPWLIEKSDLLAAFNRDGSAAPPEPESVRLSRQVDKEEARLGELVSDRGALTARLEMNRASRRVANAAAEGGDLEAQSLRETLDREHADLSNQRDAISLSIEETEAELVRFRADYAEALDREERVAREAELAQLVAEAEAATSAFGTAIRAANETYARLCSARQKLNVFGSSGEAIAMRLTDAFGERAMALRSESPGPIQWPAGTRI